MRKKNSWTVVQWSKDICADQSKLCVSFENQGNKIWRESGEARNPRCFEFSVEFLVWDNFGVTVGGGWYTVI